MSKWIPSVCTLSAMPKRDSRFKYRPYRPVGRTRRVTDTFNVMKEVEKRMNDLKKEI